MLRSALVACCCVLLPVIADGRVPVEERDGVSRLLARFQATLLSGTPAQYATLLSTLANRRRADLFAAEAIRPGVRRAVVRERDRAPLDGALPGDGYVVMTEVFLEADRMARLFTCELEVRRVAGGPGGGEQGGSGSDGEEWRIAGQRLLSELPLLHRLAIDTSTQLAGRNLVIRAPDLQLTLPSATIFAAEAGGGPTALVVLGRGEMRFAPALPAERGQLRIFGGAERLALPFDGLVLRLSPSEFRDHVSGALTRQPADPAAAKKAEEVFKEDGARSYILDLGDLSRDAWSLLPAGGDFIAEIRATRVGTLTYVRSASDAEDVSLFHRATRRNIAVYASAEHQAAGGASYGEEDRADFRVTAYDIDASFQPRQRRFDGQARLEVAVRAPLIKSLTLRLADALNVTSAASPQLGRLLAVRVRNQNSIVINLPNPLPKDAKFSLNLAYTGSLAPQAIDQEALGQFQDREEAVEEVPLAESYLYSNHSYWYPQAPSSDYATATLRLRIPSNYSCVASGRLVESGQAASGGKSLARRFTFVAAQPVRYLACLITPLVHAASTVLRLGGAPGAPTGVQDLNLAVKANPRLQRSASSLAQSAGDILGFYATLMRDSPYSDETVAAVERRLPGGHSPAYMAVINQPLPGSHTTWRNDPASFEGFPEFFTAHELAHQWWGQAVGWRNYHEQWLSEGMAQYFAALYAEHLHGRDTFDSIVQRFRDTSMERAGQGPISLGYRVGHLKNDTRALRATLYNKSALVLHMLRRTVGDEAFFAGLRRFYTTWRFRKAGTDDLRQAMEAESGRTLGRFFERWIREDAVPVVSFGWRVEAAAGGGLEAVVRLRQDTEPFDVPVTVTVEYEDGSHGDAIVQLSDHVTEHRMPVAPRVKRITVNRDGAAFGIFRPMKD